MPGAEATPEEHAVGDAMTKRRRNVLLAIGAVALLWGGSVAIGRVRDARGHVVPAHGGRDTCRVWTNDTKEAVLARCGEPCGTGGVPKARCPEELAKEQGFIALCSWDCDLYGKVWVCYCGKVMDVGADVSVVPFGDSCSSWGR